ncbi:hypothetical protein ACJX0J_022325, partial [Zea mays]
LIFNDLYIYRFLQIKWLLHIMFYNRKGGLAILIAAWNAGKDSVSMYMIDSQFWAGIMKLKARYNHTLFLWFYQFGLDLPISSIIYTLNILLMIALGHMFAFSAFNLFALNILPSLFQDSSLLYFELKALGLSVYGGETYPFQSKGSTLDWAKGCILSELFS